MRMEDMLACIPEYFFLGVVARWYVVADDFGERGERWCVEGNIIEVLGESVVGVICLYIVAGRLAGRSVG